MRKRGYLSVSLDLGRLVGCLACREGGRWRGWLVRNSTELSRAVEFDRPGRYGGEVGLGSKGRTGLADRVFAVAHPLLGRNVPPCRSEGAPAVPDDRGGARRVAAGTVRACLIRGGFPTGWQLSPSPAARADFTAAAVAERQPVPVTPLISPTDPSCIRSGWGI